MNLARLNKLMNVLATLSEPEVRYRKVESLAGSDLA